MTIKTAMFLSLLFGLLLLSLAVVTVDALVDARVIDSCYCPCLEEATVESIVTLESALPSLVEPVGTASPFVSRGEWGVMSDD